MAKIFYHAVPAGRRREEEYAFLEKVGSVAVVKWNPFKPDKGGNWFSNETIKPFGPIIPLGSEADKEGALPEAIFRTRGCGVCSNNEAFVCDFNAGALARQVRRMVDAFAVGYPRFAGD